jgi:hypothetical protein
MDDHALQNIGPRESLGRSPFRLQSDANISLRTEAVVAEKRRTLNRLSGMPDRMNPACCVF